MLAPSAKMNLSQDLHEPNCPPAFLNKTNYRLHPSVGEFHHLENSIDQVSPVRPLRHTITTGCRVTGQHVNKIYPSRLHFSSLFTPLSQRTKDCRTVRKALHVECSKPVGSETGIWQANIFFGLVIQPDHLPLPSLFLHSFLLLDLVERKHLVQSASLTLLSLRAETALSNIKRARSCNSPLTTQCLQSWPPKLTRRHRFP